MHSLAHLHSLTCSLTHSLTCSLTRSLIPSLGQVEYLRAKRVRLSELFNLMVRFLLLSPPSRPALFSQISWTSWMFPLPRASLHPLSFFLCEVIRCAPRSHSLTPLPLGHYLTPLACYLHSLPFTATSRPLTQVWRYLPQVC